MSIENKNKCYLTRVDQRLRIKIKKCSIMYTYPIDQAPLLRDFTPNPIRKMSQSAAAAKEHCVHEESDWIVALLLYECKRFKLWHFVSAAAICLRSKNHRVAAQLRAA